ncbi:MAG: monovalent cation/H(+) antiporter subunit G [Kiritimatiellia bacterium]
MILTSLIWISLAIGMTFNALGVAGILRFPDVYTRLHADTKATTFGSIFTSLAVVLYAAGEFFKDPEGQYETLALHTVLAVVVLCFTNATSAHAIARAAHKRGHKPARAVCDRLEETTP